MATPTTLTFGKYNGREIADVFAEDPSYCRWIFMQADDNTTPEIRELGPIGSRPAVLAFLAQHFDRDDDSYIMRWGKHKGKSLKQVAAIAPAYIQWLKKSEFVLSKCPRLTADLEAFE